MDFLLNGKGSKLSLILLVLPFGGLQDSSDLCYGIKAETWGRKLGNLFIHPGSLSLVL